MPARKKRNDRRTAAEIGVAVGAAILLWWLWPRFRRPGGFSVRVSADQTSIAAGGSVTFTLQAFNTSAFPLQYTILFRSPNPGTLITWNNSTTLGPFNAGTFTFSVRGTFIFYATCAASDGLTATSGDISLTVV